MKFVKWSIFSHLVAIMGTVRKELLVLENRKFTEVCCTELSQNFFPACLGGSSLEKRYQASFRGVIAIPYNYYGVALPLGFVFVLLEFWHYRVFAPLLTEILK